MKKRPATVSHHDITTRQRNEILGKKSGKNQLDDYKSLTVLLTINLLDSTLDSSRKCFPCGWEERADAGVRRNREDFFFFLTKYESR